MESVLKKSKFMIKNWWLPLLIGAAFILVSIWTISTSVASYMTLTIIFNQTLGGLTIVFFTALAFFSLGLFNITLAFILKKLKGKAGDLKEAIGSYKAKLS